MVERFVSIEEAAGSMPAFSIFLSHDAPPSIVVRTEDKNFSRSHVKLIVSEDSYPIQT